MTYAVKKSTSRSRLCWPGAGLLAQGAESHEGDGEEVWQLEAREQAAPHRRSCRGRGAALGRGGGGGGGGGHRLRGLAHNLRSRPGGGDTRTFEAGLGGRHCWAGQGPTCGGAQSCAGLEAGENDPGLRTLSSLCRNLLCHLGSFAPAPFFCNMVKN